jgi:hypothetical protein
MNRKELINAFSLLGNIFKAIAEQEEYPGTSIGLTASEYTQFEEAISKARLYNAWFTEGNVRKALKGLSFWLDDATLTNWLEGMPFSDSPKNVGIIMAGNIPLVGFHDFLSVVLSGHKAMLKLSSDDSYLWKCILSIFLKVVPHFAVCFSVQEGKMGDLEAVIATGSDNSSRYFAYYFGKYPHIIRKNRTSVAILTGNESVHDLELLAEDIFAYYGLGCRNVSQLLLPPNFDINRIFKALLSRQGIIHHHKYANNFDYQRAVALLNKEEVLENGFVLFKKSRAVYSPLAVVNYDFYQDEQDIQQFISENESKIQTVVGKAYLSFGEAQRPRIDDYADGVNTLNFLSSLK